MPSSFTAGALSGTTAVHGVRGPRQALRHVACAAGIHTTRELLFRELRHRVVRAAQLEGAHRLQGLELEPDLAGARVVEPDGGRARNHAMQALTRGLHVGELDRIRLAASVHHGSLP
jgi:hypothetical protein